MSDCVVEIIWIALVLILELVEEVENVKGECHCRTINRCQKPVCIKELDIFGKGRITTTVTDNKTVNAR